MLLEDGGRFVESGALFSCFSGRNDRITYTCLYLLVILSIPAIVSRIVFCGFVVDPEGSFDVWAGGRHLRKEAAAR